MNAILLDTNILIWLLDDSPRINSVKHLFSQPGTKVHISAVSWWELAIKERLGKLPFRVSQIEMLVSEYDFHDLPLTRNCLKAYMELPQLHKDPFDHMLLAQAITCPMRLITGDAILAEYSSLVMLI